VPENAELDLWLELASSEVVPVLARVSRVDLGLLPLRYAYGIEFVYMPPATEAVISRLVDEGTSRTPADTLWSKSWRYDVLVPMRRGERWEAEVWRSRPDQRGERFLIVSGSSSRDALRKAREVLVSWAIVRTDSWVMAPPASSASDE
jgi:hypothetical protein